MRDVSKKYSSFRTARASAVLKAAPETIQMIRDGKVPKGDPLAVSKVAAIQAAKETSRIIPYCHPVPVDFVGVDFKIGMDIIEAEVMVSDHDRAMGLMFRPSLAPDRGMIFVFESPAFHGIWMKNCRFPIDILWLDAELNIVHVAEDVPPCKADPCPIYEPLRRASYVVELNAGQARREKATVGATVSFELPR